MTVEILIVIAVVLFVPILLLIVQFNSLVSLRNYIRDAWANIDTELKRRYDLIPNLVATVKGYAAHERQVLERVIELRNQRLANTGSSAAQQAQEQQLVENLKQVLVIAENYPQLKSDALFRDLQSQLEGTENRIAVARNRYIKTVQDYNTTVRQFPTNLTAMLFKMDVKPNFSVADEATVSTPPKVDFGKQPGAPATPPPAPAKS